MSVANMQWLLPCTLHVYMYCSVQMYVYVCVATVSLYVFKNLQWVVNLYLVTIKIDVLLSGTLQYCGTMV